MPQFNYVDKGSLAVIGQHAAVVDLGFMKLTGFIAWLFWLLVHIYYLVEFDNKLVVMIQWVWNYFTRNRGARLITGKDLPLPVQVDTEVEYYTPVNDNKAVNV